ncbi:MAG TPA: hypothetical protein VF678_01780 [bacterium]
MVRNLLAALAGFLLGGLVIAAVQYVNALIYPLPPGTDLHKPEDVAKMMATIPLGALWMVEASYAFGSLVAGFIVGKIARARAEYLAIVVGVVYTGFNLVNLVQIPTPLWLAMLTTATFLPLTWLGARLATRR